MIPRRFALRIPVAAVLLFLGLVMTAACAHVPTAAGPPIAAAVSVEGFVFARDTFAFPNEVRALNPGVPDLYANYCFVLARAVRQFFSGARFDPASPRLDHAGYVDIVRRVTARRPWAAPLPPEARIIVPGYASLREFSEAEEAAVKTGLGGRFWTFVHWTNWRVTIPVSGDHQAAVAREIVEELEAGRLPQLLVSNWPRSNLNHTVIAYAARTVGDDVELTVWDPNEPERPGVITFHHQASRFEATRMFATEAGPIRVFRMYYSRLL